MQAAGHGVESVFFVVAASTPTETSAKVSLFKSVILSEASGGLAFPLAVGRAESKDLSGTSGARGIKITCRLRKAANWPLATTSGSPLIISGKSDQVLRLRPAMAGLRIRSAQDDG